MSRRAEELGALATVAAPRRRSTRACRRQPRAAPAVRHEVAEPHRAGERVDHLRPGTSSPTAAAATCADCIVAERRDERLMQTMPVAPRVDELAEPRLERAGRRRRGLGQRRRSCAADPRTRRCSARPGRRTPRLPKRIVSGTISMPSASTSSCGRSHALSVTTRTVMLPAPAVRRPYEGHRSTSADGPRSGEDARPSRMRSSGGSGEPRIAASSVYSSTLQQPEPADRHDRRQRRGPARP